MKRLIPILVILILLSFSCEEYEDIYMTNNSDERVAALIWDKPPRVDLDILRYTLDLVKYIDVDMTNSFGIIFLSENTDHFESKHQIIVYRQSTLEKYSIDEILEQGIYDMKYLYTLDELKAMNYTIVYNGESISDERNPRDGITNDEH